MTKADKCLLKEKIIKHIMLEHRLTHAEAEKIFNKMNIPEKDYEAVASGKSCHSTKIPPKTDGSGMNQI